MTTDPRKRKRFRLFVDKIVSIGAVPEGDNPARIMFSKRRTPTVDRAKRARVARAFTLPLVRAGAEPATAIERALRMGGVGADALRDVLTIDNDDGAKFAAELAAALQTETTKETKPMPKTAKEHRETVQERIERAVRKEAMVRQATERGKLSVPIGVLRAETWRSDVGRQLVDIMRKRGHEDALTLHKSALSPDQADAWVFVEQWAR